MMLPRSDGSKEPLSDIAVINMGLVEYCGIISEVDEDELYCYYWYCVGGSSFECQYKNGSIILSREFRKPGGYSTIRVLFRCELCDPLLPDKVKGFVSERFKKVADERY